jgi:hypothetical protein
MNLLGKNWGCQENTEKILDLVLPKSDNLPIPLYWKAPHSIHTTSQYSSNSAVCSLVIYQCPLRNKTPTTRNKDFLMGISQLSSLKTKHNSHLFHQNIMGLKRETDELMCMLDNNCDLSPHIISLSEH